MLKQQQKEGRLFAAICASPAVVFQHHGLLESYSATCHPSFSGEIKHHDVIESKVVVDRKCITSRGPGTALEFALKLVELLYDKEQANEISRSMVIV